MFCRHLLANMEEVQNSSLYLVEKSPAVGQSNHAASSPPLQDCRKYVPNDFRGVNISGSYVYGDTQAPYGHLEESSKLGDPLRGLTFPSKRCSQVPYTNVAHSEDNINPQPMSCHPCYATPIIQSGAQESLQRLGTPMEENGIQHPQSSCSTMSPYLIKGVICSPQSPLRSDCQPNSPTESNSSRNAALSLKHSADCLKDSKVHNWKKYKLIIMNQSSDENELEAQGDSIKASATSPSQSPCRTYATGGHGEVRPEEGASEHRQEILQSPSAGSCGIRYNFSSLTSINYRQTKTRPRINPVNVTTFAAVPGTPHVVATALPV